MYNEGENMSDTNVKSTIRATDPIIRGKERVSGVDNATQVDPILEKAEEKWAAAGIADDYIFSMVMRETDMSGELLRIILPDLSIRKIEYVQYQKTIEEGRDTHGVRLDVYVRDEEGAAYTIEMQAASRDNLEKRSRYYQSLVDTQLLEKGQPYSSLNQSYIIFICPFDLFKRGRCVYTFENMCKEDTTLLLNDAATKIFLNAGGASDNISEELRAFLDYVLGIKSDNEFVKKLDRRVQEVKQSGERKREFMMTCMRDLVNRQEGEQVGEQRLAALTEKLLEDGRYEDLKIMTKDKDYRQELYKEFGIE